MTRRKFRKEKRNREFNKHFSDPTLEKPVEADPEAIEAAFTNWKKDFLAQFPWHPTHQPDFTAA